MTTRLIDRIRSEHHDAVKKQCALRANVNQSDSFE